MPKVQSPCPNAFHCWTWGFRRERCGTATGDIAIGRELESQATELRSVRQSAHGWQPKRPLGAAGVRAILDKLGNKLQANAKATNGQALANGIAGLLGNFRLGHWGRAGFVAPSGRVGLVSLAGQLAGWACALEHWGPPGRLPLPLLRSFRGTSSRAVDAVPRAAVSPLPALGSFAELPGSLPFPSCVVLRILAPRCSPNLSRG